MSNIATKALNIIKNIDFKMLKEQKRHLINIQSNLRQDEYNEWEAMEGIINFLDTVQDFAVDELGMDEKEVFNLT